MNEKRDRKNHGPPPGLTEEGRQEWWERQRRKFVWGPGDVRITEEGEGKRPEGDDQGASPGR